MGGGLLQLVAYGAQDVYLTGNPQITFFKVAYRRHTNFAIEAIEQTFNGNPTFGSRVTCQITRNGDLINRIYLRAKLSNTGAEGALATGATGAENNGIALVPSFGLKLLKTIELEIGGQRIDKHYAEWLYIWNELSLPAGKRDGYYLMVGADRFNHSIYLAAQQSYVVNVPLEFWFCRNVGLALPLIALQYHEVKINIEFETRDNMVDTSQNYSDKAFQLVGKDYVGNVGDKKNSELGGSASNLAVSEISLWVDYIFLDTDERRRFAQLTHEYLIEQLQFTGSDTITASSTNMKSIRMNFNHPCKELIWYVKPDKTGAGAVNLYWTNFSSRTIDNNVYLGKNPVVKAKIQLNGNDRFAEREGDYFSLVQPFQHHENTPDVFHKGINVYSFAIKPEEHQPSGTLNMSRIDTAILSVASEVAGSVYIYTMNYNVLRILSGMGGLAYSN
jgi:hypothetical protein